jgi:Zeta toxin
VRIDADEIREWIPDHQSADARVYQKACTDGVNKLYDHVIGKALNVIMDGTFAYARAVESVERSLRHNRLVEIYYIYQDPLDSWRFTKEREIVEHRNVPKDVFISAFFASQANVERVKAQFGSKVALNVVVKNFDRGSSSLDLNVAGIEKYLPKAYTKEQLARILP